jgi:hypothetical protein
MNRPQKGPRKASILTWQNIAIFMFVVLVPWGLYLGTRNRVSWNQGGEEPYAQTSQASKTKDSVVDTNLAVNTNLKPDSPIKQVKQIVAKKNLLVNSDLPVQGPVPTKGM